ncbi:hypothetical protein DL240_15565 [Lujinxingia litoralis]|uniref:DUF2007 domain-containing protein n=1 Tax=Lujinxingia litoralis TaxID=2211119 RepID=A0A328C6W3_9DELT|nr:DUF2007 domain-containing protein [Lujinxingia litoralis]RAL20734.1 hypothetical protein DL240_15565 [Lujinxingia litoralis]
MRETTLVIRAYDSPVDAHIARTRLADAGIVCALEDEGIVATYAGISSAVGGVKVRVRAEDAEHARAILSQEPDGFLEDSIFVDEREARLFAEEEGDEDAGAHAPWRGESPGVISRLARWIRGR